MMREASTSSSVDDRELTASILQDFGELSQSYTSDGVDLGGEVPQLQPSVSLEEEPAPPATPAGFESPRRGSDLLGVPSEAEDVSLDTRKMEGAGEEGDMDVFAANGAEPVASTMLQRLRSTSNASFEDVNLDAHMEQPRTDSGPALTLDGVDPSAYDERGIETVQLPVPGRRKVKLGLTLSVFETDSLLPGVFVSHIHPGSIAASSKQLRVGDHILSVDGRSVVMLSLKETLKCIGKAVCNQDFLALEVARQATTFDFVMHRNTVTGTLGFTLDGLRVRSVEPESEAARVSLPIGHYVIKVNSSSVVDVPPKKVVALLRKGNPLRVRTMVPHLYTSLSKGHGAEA